MNSLEAAANKIHRSLSETAAKIIVYDALADDRYVSTNRVISGIGSVLKAGARAVESVVPTDSTYMAIESRTRSEMLGTDTVS